MAVKVPAKKVMQKTPEQLRADELRARHDEWVPWLQELHDDITEGVLDGELRALMQTVRSRLQVLFNEVSQDVREEAKQPAPSSGGWDPHKEFPLKPGDTIEFNEHVRPRYLQGRRVRIQRQKIKNYSVISMPGETLGKFGARSFGCPPALLDFSTVHRKGVSYHP